VPAPRLDTLPKAHLHLHFTGAMRPTTLHELAATHGVHLPEALRGDAPPRLQATDERGWFRFQRLYDIARSVIRTEADVRRLLLEAAQDEVRDGSGWLEIQVDPTSYAPRLGGLTPTVELILDAAAGAEAATGVGIGVILGANRTRHPLDAKTLARLAVRYGDRGAIGLGLANDERRGRAEDFAGAFRIAHAAGLLATPHGGELAGAGSVRACLDALGAHRIGHGVRAVEDPALVRRLAREGTVLEVCPSSNVALGVAKRPADVPVRTLLDAGVRVALGADDPLLFGSRLAAQYDLARSQHGLTDDALAELARTSVVASRAPGWRRHALLAGIDAWLAGSASTDARPAVTAAHPPAPAR
jgi:adenosine deaminase